ncbi:heparinase II/III family protein [Wenyingzhuangia sp. 2_MG-2023]|uniref:heparinase II/III domain-containing protein n=1 Tax=Wenyingzhuangia sp. 2_MG-2023 TaxID=3062639 RepID=UPI0026E362BA|nr:heparinase II/III family protein [Wenyingzhuangia sp. 2_MG-2023]MDO6738720.1 heparinase II/III family protein [Wenyingzhuangia sp. 2_MG-2023]MDO6803017.1 heparinase II/III family protein [Wenyingzhuangia sp. 1_MG-2023]
MNIKFILNICLITLVCTSVFSQNVQPVLKNPMSTLYLKKEIKKTLPRIVYTKKTVDLVKKKLKKDPVLINMYKAIQLNAANIYEQPLLKRVLEGRRMLDVSREFLYRINILGFVYLMEEDPKTLNRINDEVLAVCNFKDWNPSHFLDVAEMALGVAIAVDWTQNQLPKTTIELAKKSLLEKAIQKSWRKNKKWNIAYSNTNWNQVCSGGLIAASIVVADQYSEISAKTIHRALDGLPNALATYGPDGAYPEGATYWDYATAYSVTTNSMFESAFDTDFGANDVPGFMASAVFRLLSEAPSGRYFNFSDCEDFQNDNGNSSLAWFATKTGNKSFYKEESFLKAPKSMGKLSRFDGIAMLWLAQFNEKSREKLPLNWKGNGSNPLAIFRSEGEHQFYLGCKGGRASISHGNMDAGSFVFELDKVRWAIDPGVQGYHELEKEGFNLWSSAQTSDRWTLLTKNNFGHNTLTINNQLFNSGAYAKMIDFKEGESPEVTFDLTPVYGDNIKKAQRTFCKESGTSLLIVDELEFSEKTELITWQMLTTADVLITNTGAVLSKDGKKLSLENITHPNYKMSVVSLDPSPLKLDRQIKKLKRIEIRIPRKSIKSKETILKIRLKKNK